MEDPVPAGTWVRRHALATRLWHWANAAVLAGLLMSGLMIFNAHPRLYWGEYGANFDVPWLEIGAIGERGAVSLGGRTFDTTGVLGVSRGADGSPVALAFPEWATIPSTYNLADGRLWHLGLAPLLVALWCGYGAWMVAGGHLKRNLWPRNGEWKPAHIARDVLDHLRLRFGSGVRYNILQKLAYLAVLLVLLPLVIVTGLAMAPGMDAAWPWLTEVWGGRQSARSVHFLCASGLVGFFIVHIVMVVLAGPVREVRAMVTGWWRVR
ncbi:MAG: cytochrome b/b6 domain-containing protein [Sphingomonadales bacterium]|nr:cytochrome b/b6 domain-containing protein [Sphingomonadales bacterium]